MTISEAVEQVRYRIIKACDHSGRNPENIRLMGVSKLRSKEEVLEAYEAGIRLFGENRVQEAVDKFSGFLAQYPDMELHMIGSLQRKKAKIAAPFFSCIQSVDRDELIDELAKRCKERESSLDILLELHTGEESKLGYPDLEALFVATERALAHPELCIRGLMTMAPFTRDEGLIRASFRGLKSAQKELLRHFPSTDWSVLSMGMSNDFELAIEEGSTLLRIGSALFAGEEG